MKYKLLIRYRGTSFDGYQTQPSKNAVQDHVEKALYTFFRKPIKLYGSSRTDAGVHALEQMACFSISSDIDEHKVLRGLNALTPREIGILSIAPTSEEFWPISAAKSKVYCYRLWLGHCYDPFLAPYVWEIPYNFDLQKVQTSCQAFLGEHDFTSFCSADTDAATRVREIIDMQACQRGSLVEIWVHGRGFLKQMIRIMIGTLVDQARCRLTQDIPWVIEQKDRSQAGVTAPPQGLILTKIEYDSPVSIASCQQEGREGFGFSMS